ncbi:MAG: tripartite tricarboxylate transporter substrate binding protein [Betaproteobacteria bacterium]|nr:tripartite tricarboxylate transporter substrate binding protein [Betaproteobacteria bacterium]
MDKKMTANILVNALAAGAALAGLVFSAGGVQAQTYPAKTIRLVIPFVPGGGTDVMGRLIAAGLSKDLGVPVVIQNVGGAGGTIGATLVAKAAPDGYTLMAGTPGPTTIVPHMQTQLPYDPLKDFVPISQITTSPIFLLMNKDFPVSSVKDLINLARKEPGRINYASAGVGSFPHFSGELFKTRAGIQMTHVPYKGSGAAYIDLIAGRVQIFFNNIQPHDGNIQAGKIKLLAVGSLTPSGAYPGLPTIAATIPGYESSSWMGLFAPAGTPQPIVDRIYKAVGAALKDPKTRELLTTAGGEPLGSSPAEFAGFVAAKHKAMGELIKAANISLQ